MKAVVVRVFGHGRRMIGTSGRLTPFPLSLEETARAQSSVHGQFPSASSARRTRIAAIVGAVAVTAALFGVAWANCDADSSQPIDLRNSNSTTKQTAPVALEQALQVSRARSCSSSAEPPIWRWGNSNNTTLAQAATSTPTPTTTTATTTTIPAVLKHLALAKDGNDSIVAVDARGNVVLLGSNAFLLKNAQISQIASTKDSLLALTKSGTLYALDWSKLKERLLDSSAVHSPSPKSWHGVLLGASLAGVAIDADAVETITFAEGGSEKIKSISAGDNHILALSASGKVYTLATTGASVNVEIASDNNNQLGKVYPTAPMASSFVANKWGQLGLGDSAAFVPYKLYPVPSLSSSTTTKISKIAAGAAFNAVQTTDGQIFVWGSNKFGQLGTGKVKDIAFSSAPIPLSSTLSHVTKRGLTCSWIAAGGDTLFLGMESDQAAEVYSVGYGLYGQLGHGTFTHATNTPQKIPLLSNNMEYSEKLGRLIPVRVALFEAGRNHAFAALENASNDYGRTVYSWGLNDKGQLGRVDGKSGNAAAPGGVARVDLPLDAIARAEGGRDTNETGDEKTEKDNRLFWEPTVVGRLQVAGPAKMAVDGVGNVVAEQAFALGDKASALYFKIR